MKKRRGRKVKTRRIEVKTTKKEIDFSLLAQEFYKVLTQKDNEKNVPVSLKVAR